MGDPQSFYRPDRWNPEGYFEQPDFHAINMPLINGPWWKFAYFRLPSTTTILKRASRRSDQIKQTAAHYQGKVVKETRFCLTLPAWLEHGAHVDKIMICLRDPIQVARSIQKRNRSTLKHGYYLWRVHNERILENAGDIPVRFVYYNDVMREETYLHEVSAAFQFFGYDFSDEQLYTLHKRSVRSDLHHNLEDDAVYPGNVATLWQELRARHADQFKQS